MAIHAVGTTYLLRHMVRRYAGSDGHFKPHVVMPVAISTMLILMLLHLLEIILWALAYLFLLPGDAIETFEEAAYFSVVTYTTLGYGDITLLDHQWRLLSGIEALDGILLAGWSAALLFLVVQRGWHAAARAHGGQTRD